jgi:tetratricopeptide (TPR) repeat protein
VSRFDQIERYLQGKMTAEELHTFEVELAADPELAALVRQHRVERHGLELLVERDLLGKMQAWDRETELFQQLQPRRAVVRPMTWLLRAAAVLTLAALGYWLLRDDTTSPEPAPIVQTKPEIKPRVPSVRKRQQAIPRRDESIPGESTDELARQELPPAPIEEMTSGDDPDYAALADEFFRERDFVLPKGSKGGVTGSTAYNQALKNFQDGKYNDVVSKVNPNLAPDTGTDAIQQKELLALAHYQSNRYAEAAATFREIAASGKQPYAQRAEWGLTLAMLQQMPAQKGAFYRALTDILRDPEHLFYSQAKRLEERL